VKQTPEGVLRQTELADVDGVLRRMPGRS
jgi:hypothetical protein